MGHRKLITLQFAKTNHKTTFVSNKPLPENPGINKQEFEDVLKHWVCDNFRHLKQFNYEPRHIKSVKIGVE